MPIQPDAKDRLVLITGGAGYKGSTLCRELLFRGYRVRVLDNLMYGGYSLLGVLNHRNFDFVKGDITRAQDVRDVLEGVTDVIHLAAIVGDKPCECNPKAAIETNYKASCHLAEVASRHKVRNFLFASTCSNYGVADTSTLADEERKLNPVSLYAETKIDCERFLLELKNGKDFHPTVLRFGTAFGVSGRTRFDLTVNSFTYEAIKNKRLIVYAQDSWRPFTHILDMARIYCSLLEVPLERISGGIFNAGWNEHNYMKKDIVRAITEVVGKVEVDFINDIEDKRSYRVDFTKLNKLLGILSVMTLKNGIAELVEAISSGLITEDYFATNKLK